MNLFRCSSVRDLNRNTSRLIHINMIYGVKVKCQDGITTVSTCRGRSKLCFNNARKQTPRHHAVIQVDHTPSESHYITCRRKWHQYCNSNAFVPNQFLKRARSQRAGKRRWTTIRSLLKLPLCQHANEVLLTCIPFLRVLTVSKHFSALRPLFALLKRQ